MPVKTVGIKVNSEAIKRAIISARIQQVQALDLSEDCNDFFASCCGCCSTVSTVCCDMNCENYPAVIELDMSVISGDIFCSNLYTSTISLGFGGNCTEGQWVWVGTVADGTAGTLSCTGAGWTFNIESDPITDHSVELISCCEFTLDAVISLTDFFGLGCEGTVSTHFTASDWDVENGCVPSCCASLEPSLFITVTGTGGCAGNVDTATFDLAVGETDIWAGGFFDTAMCLIDGSISCINGSWTMTILYGDVIDGFPYMATTTFSLDVGSCNPLYLTGESGVIRTAEDPPSACECSGTLQVVVTF